MHEAERVVLLGLPELGWYISGLTPTLLHPVSGYFPPLPISSLIVTVTIYPAS